MNNLFSQKIDLMRTQWVKAAAVPGVEAIRWFIKPDEWSMINAFFDTESSGSGKLSDIFFVMSTPFENDRVYTKHLHEEWKEKYDGDKETFALLEQNGININYTPATDHTVSFFNEIQKLAAAISTPEIQRNIVLYLAPSSVNDIKLLVQWIAQAIKTGLPSQVKIMLVDDEEHKRYTRLSDDYPRQVKTILPNLNMSELMRKVATSGNPAAPDVQFRKCVFEMADAAAKKDIDLLGSLGKKAAGIAAKAGWKHLIAAASIITAGHMFSLKKYKRSESLYNEAIDVSRNAYTDGDVTCGSLLTQCYALRGASMMLQGEKDIAMQSYIQMARHAEEMNDLLGAMEGWRLAADAADKSGKPRDSFDFYTHAWEKGKQLDEKVRPYSCFLIVGEGLIEIAQLSGNSHHLPAIKDQLVSFAGPDWEKQLEKMKQTV